MMGAGEPWWEPWWGWKWDETASGMYTYLLCCTMAFFIMNALQWNWAMIRLIYMRVRRSLRSEKSCVGVARLALTLDSLVQAKVRVGVTIGLSLVYAFAAFSILPNFHHLLWLFTRTIVIVSICASDARLVTHRLRFTKATFAKKFGNEGRRGWATVIIGIVFVTFAVCDIFRHGLILFATTKTEFVDFHISNPVTGGEVAITNHNIAGSAYFSSVVVVGGVVFNQLHAYSNSETTLATCRFDYSCR